LKRFDVGQAEGDPTNERVFLDWTHCDVLLENATCFLGLDHWSQRHVNHLLPGEQKVQSGILETFFDGRVRW
jgi:hypothetical protein